MCLLNIYPFIFQNVPSSQAALVKNSQSKPVQSQNFSLGLLPADAMSGMMDNSTNNMHLHRHGRYPPPAHSSPESIASASQSEPLSGDEADNVQEPVDTPSHSFLATLAPPPTPYRQVSSSTSSALGLSVGLPWDKIVIRNTSEDIPRDQKVCEDILDYMHCICMGLVERGSPVGWYHNHTKPSI
jgi:hypothetical protein